MTVNLKLTFEASRDEKAAAQTVLDAANARAAAVDTQHAEAGAALQAALDDQGLLSARIAKGGGVKPSEAGAAAALITQRREHLTLFAGAKEIAAKDVADAEQAFRHARLSHRAHEIRAAELARAAALRELAADGLRFGASVDRASATAQALLSIQLEAQAEAKVVIQPINTFDTSKTATRWLCRALPQHIITAVRESMIEYWDFKAEASQIEASAKL